MQMVETNPSRSHLSFWGSSIVLQIAPVRVVLNPGDLVLAHSVDGILHCLVDDRVHRRHKEVEGSQELLPVLGQVPLRIWNTNVAKHQIGNI